MAKRGRGAEQKGAANGRAKFTEDDVRTIRRLAAEGQSYAHLGDVYETTPENISFIVRRIRWKHVA